MELDAGQARALFCKKGKSKKKPGRKTNWSKAATNDLVDIIVNDSGYKTKLIFVNTKNQTNGSIHEAILKELKVGHLLGVRILLLTSIRSELNLRNV